MPRGKVSLQWSNVLTALKCPIGYVNHTATVNWAVLQRACSVAATEFDCIFFGLDHRVGHPCPL